MSDELAMWKALAAKAQQESVAARTELEALKRNPQAPPWIAGFVRASVTEDADGKPAQIRVVNEEMFKLIRRLHRWVKEARKR